MTDSLCGTVTLSPAIPNASTAFQRIPQILRKHIERQIGIILLSNFECCIMDQRRPTMRDRMADYSDKFSVILYISFHLPTIHKQEKQI